MAYVELGLRLTLAGVLLVSGFAKVRARGVTADMIAQVLDLVRLRLPSASVTAVWLLIMVELCVGGILLIGESLTIVGFGFALPLLALFTGLAMVSANRNVKLRCACFGHGATYLGWRHVYRDLALVVLATVGLVLHLVLPDQQRQMAGVVISVAGAVVVTVLVIHYDNIVDLIRPTSKVASVMPPYSTKE